MRKEAPSSTKLIRAAEVLDDTTSAYAISAHTCFEKFHGAANRLAGLLVLLAIAKSRLVLDVQVQAAAARLIKAGNEEFRALRSTPRSQHFHSHLANAGNLLRVAMEHVERTLAGSASARDPLVPLQAAWSELRNASKCLPGFEVVDFRHSCCALHETAIS
ncbi:hypothetical protein [Rhizobium bangladeshense]|uniref:hypothetical protein n=1 Tax=Rhizobium bangladeshense TaxID=1138189 RepID=UPI001C82E1E3|nr:hypothetical protein [Rhizobium bangladeshense]MBX4901262.1 hypothetical protein [Rhizobium bangladeshense]MBX4915350.1 hypothetical protein [Rhizobium bangladeshense]MBX4922146.1 hypothetical protein [Rhizobium bangladeshense]MBY3599347.1 hypothetical protein [Rhizobium bangladeshense]